MWYSDSIKRKSQERTNAMRTEFELWLDESGDFTQDKLKVKKGLNPSHIGGILVQKGEFGKNALDAVFPEEDFHATEKKGEEGKQEVFDRFCRIEKKAEAIRKSGKFIRYVAFTNRECIMVLDDSITYQNIMAEGIARVIQKLKARYREIKLDVWIASRRDAGRHFDGSTIVPLEEYERKLKERILMAKIRHKIEDEEWSLKIGLAKRVPFLKEKADKRLMAADVICNCFLTRNTKMKENKEIQAVYEDEEKTMVCSVLPASMESEFQELMAENRLGEAVAVICQCDVPEVITSCMAGVRQRLEELSDREIELQYGFLKALFEYYLNVTYAYRQCENMLKNLLRYFIPVLRHSEIVEKLTFDLNFYLLTVYTHMGDVAAASLAQEACEQAFCRLPSNWSMVDLGIKYEQRKVIHQINLFDFSKAAALNEALLNKCQDIRELLSLYREDVTYDELAKALGTQVQIEAFLLRHSGQKSEDYARAVGYSNAAIREFTSGADKRRQYLYRVQLETEAGEFACAYKYLCLANGFEGCVSEKELWQELKKEGRIYELCAYVRLMAESKLTGWERSDALYGALVQSAAMQELLAGGKGGHPMELIFWKYAGYLSLKLGKVSDVYKTALELCFEKEDLTLHLIGLGAELERYAFALKLNQKKDGQQWKKALQKRYANLYEKLPESMKRVFGEIRFDEESWEYYFALSRKITY